MTENPEATPEQIASVACLLTRDLMFISKVTSTAEALGHNVLVVGQTEAAVDICLDGDCHTLFIDLALGDVDLPALVARMPSEDRPRIIAFGAHVETDRLEAARKAGCHEVLPRSKFSATLPELLKRAFAEV